MYCRTSENIGNVTDVELTQIGTFTGELGRDKINGISDVSKTYQSAETDNSSCQHMLGLFYNGLTFNCKNNFSQALL